MEGAPVGILLVLLDGAARGSSIDAATAGQLAQVGVTNIALVRDEETVGILLDGWAFDPARSGAYAARLFGRTPKILTSVLEMVLTPPERVSDP